MRPSLPIFSALTILAHLYSSGFATAQTVACNDIGSKLFYLRAGYDPIAYGNCDQTSCAAHPPKEYVTGAVPPGSNDAQDLQSAFNIAPPFFKDALCSLDAIYVDTESVNMNRPKKPIVWGMRVRYENGTTQIGINQQILVNYRRSTTPLTDNENYILHNLPGALPTSYRYIRADPDTKAMAILSNLAHEMGHIVWWQQSLNDRQCKYWYFFEISSWATKGNYKHGQIPHSFHEFAAPNPSENSNLGRPGVYRIVSEGPSRAAANLASTYSGDWASLFATVSVDEDFIETYKLWVLTQAQSPLQHLQLAIAWMIPPIDIVTQNFNNANTILYQKRGWINTLINSSGSCT